MQLMTIPSIIKKLSNCLMLFAIWVDQHWFTADTAVIGNTKIKGGVSIAFIYHWSHQLDYHQVDENEGHSPRAVPITDRACEAISLHFCD